MNAPFEVSYKSPSTLWRSLICICFIWLLYFLISWCNLAPPANRVVLHKGHFFYDYIRSSNKNMQILILNGLFILFKARNSETILKIFSKLKISKKNWRKLPLFCFFCLQKNFPFVKKVTFNTWIVDSFSLTLCLLQS